MTGTGAGLFRTKKSRIAFIAAFAAVPLLYAIYTAHVWEDFFITFRFSENFAHGRGLVFNPGERVHGFTSPIGVLLPAFFQWVSGAGDYQLPLWIFRAVSAMAVGWSAWLVVQSPLAGAVGVVWLVLDFKTVAYTANGQETAFMLLGVAGVLAQWERDQFDPRWRGIAWALLMWTRPDGCVFIAALTIAEVAFYRRWRGMGISFFIASAIYLPWFIFAWSYYGSPVPHTVLAKGQAIGVGLSSISARSLLRGAADTFGPVYPQFGGWPRWLRYAHGALGLFCLLYWIFPSRDRVGRAASFAFAVMLFYFAAIRTWPWYFPPVALLAIVVLARGIGRSRMGVAIVTGLFFFLFAQEVRSIKIQQAVVENGNREPLGRWLRTEVKSGEKVLLEPLGYIGYFSGARIVDVPGLVSPEIVRWRRAQPGLGWKEIAERVRAEWLVVRPGELREIGVEVMREYSLKKVFSVKAPLRGRGNFLGINYAEFDSEFLVFARKPSG